jgi:hypothetical protein
MTTATAPAKDGFSALQQDLQSEALSYQDCWVFSPLLTIPFQRFPHLVARAGEITPVPGSKLPLHYGGLEFDEETLNAAGNKLKFVKSPVSDAGNYLSFAKPTTVASAFANQNAGYGTAELTELRGISEDQYEAINKKFFPNGKANTEALPHLDGLVAKGDPITKEVAQKLITAIEKAGEIAEGIVTEANARIATPGNKEKINDFERVCFGYLGVPTPGRSSATVTTIPAAPQMPSDLLAVLKDLQDKAEVERKADRDAFLTALAAITKPAPQPTAAPSNKK